MRIKWGFVQMNLSFGAQSVSSCWTCDHCVWGYNTYNHFLMFIHTVQWWFMIFVHMSGTSARATSSLCLNLSFFGCCTSNLLCWGRVKSGNNETACQQVRSWFVLNQWVTLITEIYTVCFQTGHHVTGNIYLFKWMGLLDKRMALSSLLRSSENKSILIYC